MHGGADMAEYIVTLIVRRRRRVYHHRDGSGAFVVRKVKVWEPSSGEAIISAIKQVGKLRVLDVCRCMTAIEREYEARRAAWYRGVGRTNGVKQCQKRFFPRPKF